MINNIHKEDFKKYYKYLYNKSLDGLFYINCNIRNIDNKTITLIQVNLKYDDNCTTKFFYYDNYINWLRKHKIEKILSM